MNAKRDYRDQRIAIANSALRRDGIELAIERRDAKLGLRGTLPDSKSITGRKQKRIPLDLPATETGIDIAIQRAKDLWEELCRITDADEIKLHDAVRDRECSQTEVLIDRVSRDRADGIDAEGAIVEVKSTDATARDVGQLFGYMYRKGIKQGRLIAPSFKDEALALIEAINILPKGMVIKAQRIVIEDVA